jgi:serine/threonine protein kinase
MSLDPILASLEGFNAFNYQYLPETMAFIRKKAKKKLVPNTRFKARYDEEGQKRSPPLCGGIIYLGEKRFVINLSKKFSVGGYKSVKLALLVDLSAVSAFKVVNACCHFDQSLENDRLSLIWERRVADLSKIAPDKFVEVFAVVKSERARKFSLIQRLCHQDLLKALTYPTFKPLSRSRSIKIALQILNTLQFLHARNIAHLDIKLGNVLLTKNNREAFLHDFGSCNKADDPNCLYQNYRGTEKFAPPERWSKNKSQNRHVGVAADIWQLGLLLNELFLNPLTIDQVKVTYELDLGQALSRQPALYDRIEPRKNNDIAIAIKAMLHFDPDRRPSLNWVRLVLIKTQASTNPLQPLGFNASR